MIIKKAEETAQFIWDYYRKQSTPRAIFKRVEIIYHEDGWTEFVVHYSHIVEVSAMDAVTHGMGWLRPEAKPVEREVPATLCFRADRENLLNDTLRKELEKSDDKHGH